MTRWPKRLFLASFHVASDAADFFSLPERTVIMGSLIDV